MRPWLLAALALCGCDPIWSFEVTVTAPTGEPLADAVLAITGCPEQNDHDIGTVAALTDEDGDAAVGGLGTRYPPCDVTVAKPGFATWRTSFDALCDGDRDDCDRVQQRRVVLAPSE